MTAAQPMKVLATRSSLPSSNAPTLSRWILWLDCSGGLLVGGMMVACSAWLSRLYQLPPRLYFAIAAANITYGVFSLFLALRRRRPLSLIVTLAAANTLWGGVCIVMAAVMLGRASVFGLGHILTEGAVVFALAYGEWRCRHLLVRA
jgi:hypothetical protein